MKLIQFEQNITISQWTITKVWKDDCRFWCLSVFQLIPSTPTGTRRYRNVISWLSWKTSPTMGIDIKVSCWLLSYGYSWLLLTPCSRLHRKEFFSFSGLVLRLKRFGFRSQGQGKSVSRTNFFLIYRLVYRYWVPYEFLD